VKALECTAAEHTGTGCVQRRGRAASHVPTAGPASPGMFVRKSAAAHMSGFCVPTVCFDIALATIIFLFR